MATNSDPSTPLTGRPANGGSPDDDGDVLQSWKDIGAFLGVSARRAQQWETELGLPVSRLDVGRKKRVSASRAALRAWQDSLTVTKDESIADASPGIVTGSGGVPSRWRWLGIAVLGVGLAAMLWYAMHAWPRRLETARLGPQEIVAFDANGRTIWTVSVPEMSRTSRRDPAGTVRANGTWRSDTIIVDDLDGDGTREVAAVVPTAWPWNDRLAIFNAAGQPRWHYKPGRPLEWAGRQFDEHYVINWIMGPVVVDGRHYIIMSASNEFFPCQLTLLDAKTGTVVGEYWHPGELGTAAVADLDRDGRPELIAGGFNNPGPGDGMPGLLVLPLPFGRPTRTKGHVFFPELDGPHARYLLFPRADLFELERRPSGITDLVWDDDTGLSAVVAMGTHLYGKGQLHYHLDRSLTVQSVTPCDNFRASHHTLWRAGVLDHDINAAELAAWARLEAMAHVPNGNAPKAADPNHP